MNLVGPNVRPPIKPGDFHLVVNDPAEAAKMFDHTGKLLWKRPALARGLYGPDWRRRNADTPPGLYRAGELYLDKDREAEVPLGIKMAYGWLTIDMVDLERQEADIGRSGICLHGGGSANGWPGAWAALQPLHPTHGCVRMHNTHLYNDILPLYRKAVAARRYLYISVYQDAP